MSSIAMIFLHRSTQRSKADYSLINGQTVRVDPQCGLTYTYPKFHVEAHRMRTIWHNTSTACTECGAQLVPVYQLHNQNVFQTRGLKWCNSSECKGCPLKHRENIGAINISTMFLFEVYGVPLPVLLDRYHPVQALKLNTKRLANQYHLRAPHSSIGKNAKKRAYHLG